MVTRSPDHIKYLLGGNGTEDFPRPANVIANIHLMFGRAQIGLDGQDHQDNKRMLSNWFFNEKDNESMAHPVFAVASELTQVLARESARNGVARLTFLSPLPCPPIPCLLMPSPQLPCLLLLCSEKAAVEKAAAKSDALFL